MTDKIKRLELGTKNQITWCPGCPNFMVLQAVKNTFAKLVNEGYKQEGFAMATGIGCHQKIYDYLNIRGIYGVHGRVVPICLGMKLGNPNLNVIGFAGDGDAYAEGIEHLVHAGRFNPDMVYVVGNNQNFALTTGQPTPVSQQGYKSKAEPLGEFNKPINPIKIALASGISFVARCNAKDIVHTSEILEKAIKHKGFAFVEIMVDCLVFNLESSFRNHETYKVENGKDMKKAFELAEEWDYNKKQGKVPVGIFYQEEKPILEEEWPQIKKVLEKKIWWKGLK